jgi:hypothetical protein
MCILNAIYAKKKLLDVKKKVEIHVEIYNILDILIYALSLKKADNFKKFMVIKFWSDYILPTCCYNDNGNLKFAAEQYYATKI